MARPQDVTSVRRDRIGPLELLGSIRRHPAGLLLAAQLLGVLSYPLMEDTDAGRAALGAFGIVALSLVLWVVNRSPTVNWIAWVLAGTSIVLTVVSHAQDSPQLLALAHLLDAVLYFYAAVGLIFYMLDDARVTTDELIAAGATFTLLVWAFAYALSVCQAWYPGSLSGVGDAAAPRSWIELLYLSFALVSGVGLSDIVPVTAPARALGMLAMFTGVMYIAIVVSRLIALTVIRQQGK